MINVEHLSYLKLTNLKTNPTLFINKNISLTLSDSMLTDIQKITNPFHIFNLNDELQYINLKKINNIRKIGDNYQLLFSELDSNYNYNSTTTIEKDNELYGYIENTLLKQAEYISIENGKYFINMAANFPYIREIKHVKHKLLGDCITTGWGDYLPIDHENLNNLNNYQKEILKHHAKHTESLIYKHTAPNKLTQSQIEDLALKSNYIKVYPQTQNQNNSQLYFTTPHDNIGGIFNYNHESLYNLLVDKDFIMMDIKDSVAKLLINSKNITSTNTVSYFSSTISSNLFTNVYFNNTKHPLLLQDISSEDFFAIYEKNQMSQFIHTNQFKTKTKSNKI